MRLLFVPVFIVVVLTTVSYSYRILPSSDLRSYNFGTGVRPESDGGRDTNYERPSIFGLRREPIVPTAASSDNWINCGNGNRFLYEWICDFDDDCGNGYDEKNCEYLRNVYRTEAKTNNPLQNRVDEDDDDDDDDTLEDMLRRQEQARSRLRLLLGLGRPTQTPATEQDDDKEVELTNDEIQRQQEARARIQQIMQRLFPGYETSAAVGNEQIAVNNGKKLMLNMVVTHVQMQVWQPDVEDDLSAK